LAHEPTQRKEIVYSTVMATDAPVIPMSTEVIPF
jgi:hypothetical protein